MLHISFIFFFSLASAHSWVECVDYTGPTDVYDPSLCQALPRPLADGRNVGTTFGLDIGMDHRPGNSGNQCQGNVARGLSQNYGGNMATYQVGQTYTLAWPPKNHVAAPCTNPYIPDNSLELFVAPYNDVSDPSQFTNLVPASFTSDPHVGNTIDYKGFQNCPKFCDNTDKSLCTGTFVVPDLPSGTYTFQWKWAFNSAADIYSTCWEAEVVGGNAIINTTTTNLPQSTVATTSTTTDVTTTTNPSTWNNGMKLTHFWDCNGMGCDATTLQPWDQDKYVAAPGYAPQDPIDFGGPSYGEKLWVVGAASDDLANLLGTDDGCCGSDNNSMGCGKCALIRVPSATNPDWTAIIMKKNRCPPNSNGCSAGNVHVDVAVPGYDNLAYSTANVCGQRDGTGFNSQSESAILGDWYNNYQNTAQASALCDNLPVQFQKGCQLFSDWGWKTGNPDAEYQVVACPEAFKSYVADQFNADGVVSESTTTGSETTTTESGTSTTVLETTSTPSTTSTSNSDGACFIFQCGCPDDFKESWCTVESHQMMDTFCGGNQQNCETCAGSWCPYDGPGGSLTTTTTTESTTPLTTSTTETSTTSSTEASTSTTNGITSTTTLGTSCGYMPTKCENKIRTAHDTDRFTKTYGKFEEITGVPQADATFEDMQLYWYCKGKSANKCTGMELPCSCSSPPCVCADDQTTTVTTTGQQTSQTTTQLTTLSTTEASTSTTEATTSTQSTMNCALSVCGCSQNGQSWCNSSNSWLATEWCHELQSNCESCNGVWCDGAIA